jgi:histidinol dehydrogenase
MQTFEFPLRADWPALLKRPQFDTSSVEDIVVNIMKEVKENGDEAVKKYTLQFDKADIEEVLVPAEKIQAAATMISPSLKNAILLAKKNIENFHRPQMQILPPVETMPGITCWRKNLPIEKVGLYIPGGSAPLFSTVLMLGIPAMLAGCREIVLCSPPDASGELHPAILYAASLVGITKIVRVGGVQAIAAMTYGTASVPKVNKLFGPGNRYVTTAKQFAQQHDVAIDMPAGPSEVAIFADDAAIPSFVAADLLSQAEHGVDSQVILVSTSKNMIEKVNEEIDIQLTSLTRKGIAKRSLENARFFLVKNENEAMDLLNLYAPEHLILDCENPGRCAEKVINAGSVFLGNYSPEAAGDYASGTNHTLPTNGFASIYSGVSVDSFVKKVTFQELTKKGLENIGDAVQLMAGAEGLDAHARAISIRLQS